jgi:imidazole glycerol-phosphate synthase subunit HisH
MIAIIKYNSGNVQSVQYALDRLGASSIVTSNEQEIRNADKVIFPGVGHAGAAMQSVIDNNLHELIPTLTQPVLGICVGMQLMCVHSQEGDTKCLGIFDTEVNKFESTTLKIPQMGWNTIYNFKGSLFTNLQSEAYIYNVHSYYAAVNNDTAATCNYQLEYSAALQKNNFYALQFHPEKSGKVGEQILKNFLAL